MTAWAGLTVDRITVVLSVESKTLSEVSQQAVKMYVESFKTNVINFVGNVIMCLTLH